MISRTCAPEALVALLCMCGCATPPPTAENRSSPCVISTGSRLPNPDNHCTAEGRSYSQSDLEQTGKTTVGGALGMLDPSVTINH